MRSLWVANLFISDRTADKIVTKHRIYPAEVRDAVVCVAGLQYQWDTDPERGLRAIVATSIRRREVIVVLYERSDPLGDSYNLGSAYFVVP